jgi:hypothetical protein
MAPSQKEVALIIGASRGIGRQVAIDLAKEGYAGKPTFLKPNAAVANTLQSS